MLALGPLPHLSARAPRGALPRLASLGVDDARAARACRVRIRSASVSFDPAAGGTVEGPFPEPGVGRPELRIDSIGESGPSSVAVSRATSAATSSMRSRSTAFSMRSYAPTFSPSRFTAAISRCSLSRSSWDRLSSFSISDFSVLSVSIATRLRSCAWASWARSSASILQQARLLVASRGELLETRAERLRFCRLSHELPIELGDTVDKIIGAGALLGKLSARCLDFGGLGVQMFPQRFRFFLVTFELPL